MSSTHQTNLLFLSISSAFCMAGKIDSDVGEELRSSAISAIGVRDLAASRDIVAVTGRGGFPSAASRRWLEIIRSAYSGKKSGR
jgi:hypothetical protein